MQLPDPLSDGAALSASDRTASGDEALTQVTPPDVLDLLSTDRLYREAEDELTAKEMRSYAWLEVQRGFLAFSRGGYPEARSHYDIAEAAYPGYWLVGEYQAELLGAEGRHAEAIELFGRLGVP